MSRSFSLRIGMLLAFAGATYSLDDCVPASQIQNSNRVVRTLGSTGFGSGVLGQDPSDRCCKLSSIGTVCGDAAADDGVIVSNDLFLASAARSRRSSLPSRGLAGNVNDGNDVPPFRVKLTRSNPTQKVVNTGAPFAYDAEYTLVEAAVKLATTTDKIVHMVGKIQRPGLFPPAGGMCFLQQVSTYLGSGLPFQLCRPAPLQPKHSGTLPSFEFCTLEIGHSDFSDGAWVAVRIADTYYSIGTVSRSEPKFSFKLQLYQDCAVAPKDNQRWLLGQFSMSLNPESNSWMIGVKSKECTGLSNGGLGPSCINNNFLVKE